MLREFQPSVISGYCADEHELTLDKSRALYDLVQTKGRTYQGLIPTKLKGLKALEFAPNEFIAIRRIPISTGSFFPCYLCSYHFTY